MLIPVLLFCLGLVLLIKGGDWFVDGATAMSHRFHLPELLIGATVVSIGTTLPEVMVSATAAVEAAKTGLGAGIAYGNAIGSVICNTGLIAALTIAIRPTKVSRKSLIVPTAAFFIAGIFYSAVAYISGSFSRVVGIALLLMFVCYILLTIWQMKKHPEMAESEETKNDSKENPLWKDIVLLILGAACIAVGANLLVNNGTKIAAALGVPDSVIGLTIVALGTSLPELVTAITALVKGHSALSLGNIIGANFFNLALVTGTAATIAPFKIPESTTLFGINSSLVLEIPLMLAVMAILCLPALKREKLSRTQGIILLVLYAGFCIFQFAA